ncbi:MAG TPA: CHAD domain-containing protein [Methylomirabilota bacterium]|nr:CHAD domain-containing protein [Methylomirabilota bacterium]
MFGPASGPDQGQRARYAAELVQPTAGRRGKRFIKAAKAVQDILGEHQRDRRERARAAFDETWPRLARRGRKAWREPPDAESER